MLLAIVGLFGIGIQGVFAATATVTDKGDSFLYTYTSTACSERILTKEVGIVLPKNLPNPGTTYIYFHGNDEPSIADICKGSKYKICDAAAALGSPVIIPKVNVAGSSKEARITSQEFTCILNEAKQVMAANNITLAPSYIVAGHSGGAFTMSSYFAANLDAQKVLVFDGCYTGGENNKYNFCGDIITYFKNGPINIYYQTSSQGTEEESVKARASAPDRITLKKINLSHYALPTACLKDQATCGGKVLEKQDASPSGTTGSAAPTNAAKTNASYSVNAIPITTVTLTNPIGSTSNNPKGTTDIRVILGNIVQVGLTIIGAITFMIFIIGGTYWLLSAGNADRVKKGTETMIWAVIGLFVVFGAYGILSTVISGLTGRPANDNTTTVTSGGNDANTPAIIDYRKVVSDADVPILSQPKQNVISRGTLGKTTDCVPITGKGENGYLEIQDPGNPQLYGWVPEAVLQNTTSKCGS